jgi:hypothetical protein
MKSLALLLALVLPASAETSSFAWFNGANDAGVIVNASTEQVGSDVLLTISNESTLQSAVVTGIWFEGETTPLFIPSTDAVAFSFDEGQNLPGGNTINWTGSTAFIADAPPTKNGLSSGESAVFRFVDANEADISDERIALHVQAINGSSGSWVNTVPEPSCVLLSAFSLGLFVKRRR